MTAVLPGFFTLLGAPAIALGLTEGISNLAQAMAALWGGWVNDRYARRHRILTWGYVLTGAKALVAVVSWWPWVVLLRTIGWLGRGARGPIRDAYIAEEVPAQDVGRAYGLREAFDTVGALLGPITAAVLVTLLSPRELIAVSAVPALLTVLIIARVRRLPLPRQEQAGHVPRVAPTRWPLPFRWYRIATGTFTAGYLAPTFFILQVWQSRVSWGPWTSHTLALALYTLHNGVYAASAYPVGHVAGRHSGRTLLLAGYGIWVVAMTGFAVNPGNLGGWAMLFAATGLATAFIEVGQKLVTVGMVPETIRGQALGQIAAIRGVGQLVAGVVTGALWTLGQMRLGFATEAGLAGVGCLLTLRAVQTKAGGRRDSTTLNT